MSATKIKEKKSIIKVAEPLHTITEEESNGNRHHTMLMKASNNNILEYFSWKPNNSYLEAVHLLNKDENKFVVCCFIIDEIYSTYLIERERLIMAKQNPMINIMIIRVFEGKQKMQSTYWHKIGDEAAAKKISETLPEGFFEGKRGFYINRDEWEQKCETIIRSNTLKEQIVRLFNKEDVNVILNS